ncbi:MAG: vitamin B12 transporter [Candidatus Electronema aureum]|uniref:Vitamin B12 transporter n=1 Tax=Candidatus Electronema aureum TaxID=2005002 RepID=A0A521FYZ8_9BACT|nr:MAG: vitamin B12 transporter [Candidatus Electronema aureum]
MKHRHVVLVCPLLAVACAAESFATAPVLMDEVVVTASRTEESRKTVSANVTVITQEDIQQSASRNLGDLLTEKAVGTIRTYPGGMTVVGLRGFRTDTHGNDLQGHVLILLNGRRAGTGNAAKLLTENVERIEIIRGPGAVQYGSAGMGGVINVITRRAKGKSLFMEGGAGSFAAHKLSIGGTTVADSFDFSGSVSHSEQDDYKTGSGRNYGNTANQQRDVSMNAGWSFAENNRLGLIFTGSDIDDAGSPGYLNQNDLDDRTDKDNYSVDFSYTGKSATAPYQWMARYFFGQDNNSWFDGSASNPDGWDDDTISKNKTNQQGAQAHLSGQFGSALLTGGFDWLDYEVENTWTPNAADYANPAVFLLGKNSLFDEQLTISAGLRHDWYQVKVNEPVGRDADASHFTPQVGLAWMITKEFKLRTQYAQGFMLPSADQLSADFTNFGTRTVGNPDLEPETNSTYELGVDFSRSSFNATLTGFHTDFEDKIIVDALDNGTRTWKNLGDATIAGFEGEFSYDLGLLMGWSWELRPYLNLTLLTEYEDETTGEDLQQISDSNISAGLIADNGDGLSFRLNIAYMGSQLVQDWESVASPVPLVELDASTVTDATASWRFYQNDQLGAFSLRGEARNLFDEDYAYIKGYPLPGRSFFAALRWEY